MYSIVDIETTGSHAHRHSITEVAIINFDGEKITDRFSSLVQPDSNIPNFISWFTGITADMVEQAPSFDDLADTIDDLTHGRILVAHNAHFDYSFLKSAFLQRGQTFSRKVLCTMRLSRQLFPGLHSYSLDRLCNHFGLQQHAIHRAEDDALAALELFQMLVKSDTHGAIELSLKKRSGEFTLPPNLPKEKIQSLPDAAGVYYFIGKKNEILYVGKAKSLRGRVWQHFLSNSSTRARTRLMNSIHDIRFELCGNELVAMLKESAEIKKYFPPFNVIQKLADSNFGLYSYEDGRGYLRFAIKKLSSTDRPLASFLSLQEARNFLAEKASEFQLCPRLCNLQHTTGACFDYETGTCDGACMGKISSADYNHRVQAAIEATQTDSMTFAVIGEGRNKSERSVVAMENGKYLGYGFLPSLESEKNFQSIKEFIVPQRDNREVQLILRSYLNAHDEYAVLLQ